MMDFEQFIERIRCPICGRGDFRVLAPPRYTPGGIDLDAIYRSATQEERIDQLVECAGCRLVYLNPRIRSDLIVAAYAAAEDPMFASQNWMRIRTFHRVLRRLAPRAGLLPGDRVLDVGAAAGAFVRAAKDVGFECVGVEPSRWLCEFGRREFDVDLRVGYLEEQSFPDGTFDLVALWDVLEHVTDPAGLLDECRRVLSDGGSLCVNFPDYSSIARRVLRSKWPFFLNAHLYYFTRETLTLLLKQSGFRPLYFRPFWQTLELGYILGRASRQFRMFGIAQSTVRKLGIGHIPLTYQMGQTLALAARDSS